MLIRDGLTMSKLFLTKTTLCHRKKHPVRHSYFNYNLVDPEPIMIIFGIVNKVATKSFFPIMCYMFTYDKL